MMQHQFLAGGTGYGAAAGVGDDDWDVWGGLEGGDVKGTGGLGLVGVGRGGGGSGQGTIGLGNVGLIGKGGSGCSVCRQPAKPRIQVDRAHVEGALDSSILRRITKAKTRQIQACYDDALHRAPALKGKLELKYVIALDGVVSAVLIEQSPDRFVGECVAKVFRHSRFPPSTSATIVRQPITLDPR